ncbi:integrase catalytic domain-containing protein [Trichonephila clavata]|uniref:Integrase catalytic domain-containing protein n=1 Tax=Trichonephila clavata TaxID=2740835 RepID=A0A8X6JZI0_TRICU|nr:integrase catalytic domain-containing protein [Trichonephila clavata]
MRNVQSDKVYSENYLLISFRSNKIAILADVEKAFLQISLTPKDKDVVRFLIDNGENGVNVYRFNRVLFGVNASPFLLAATIKTHIEKYVEKYPDTVWILDHCFYVDDLVTGEDDIPRYALECDSANCPECEIDTFSDASIKAYGAVSYVRLKTSNKISVHLLASKSRVAPLKSLTLPRLELMGALLAARLAKEVSRVLNGKTSTTNYFWTDSTIVLSWIQGPSSRWKVFVANRVKEIRSLTDKDSWHHCPGKDNPSDLLTRGISADSLMNCDKWWNGPSFLHEENTVPVSYNVLLSDESAYLEELRLSEKKTLTVTLDNTLLNNILSVYNNFQKILCVFSYIYRFINNFKKPPNKLVQ